MVTIDYISTSEKMNSRLNFFMPVQFKYAIRRARAMGDLMEDIWLPTSSSPMVFSRCDICGEQYEAPASEINNPTSAISEEELNEQVPMLLLCYSCREKLELFPLTKS
jgi:hypothetical protein